MNPDSPCLRVSVVIALGLIIHEAVLRGLRIDGIRPDLLLAIGIVASLVGVAPTIICVLCPAGA